MGQMLDHAANGARYRPAALLRRSLEEACKADGRLLEEAYGCRRGVGRGEADGANG
ncbi:hypothetical protein [Streptomyces inhibens]|uniref:hypothetical protein n=1 Tax=Streptomyces inhibens TaxID=2293571 RepID=UPI001EE6D4FD|nr:hypothetical protein [Streptomyces inhibens]UKY55587.1 hypothetical protein KI385_03670 [Streptomyces inhibens]